MNMIAMGYKIGGIVNAWFMRKPRILCKPNWNFNVADSSTQRKFRFCGMQLSLALKHLRDLAK